MNFIRSTTLGLALVGSLTVGMPPSNAQAEPYTGLLSQFNEIVFGNAVSGSETEGRTVIGGNLSQSGSGNYCFQSSDGSGPCGTSPLPATTPQITGITVGAATQSFGALAVYGDLAGSTVNGSKGNVFIGGTNTAPLSLPAGSQTAYVSNQGTSAAVGGSGNLVYTTKNPSVTPSSQNGTVKQGSFVLPDFKATFQDPLEYLSGYLAGLTGVAQGTSNVFNAAPTNIGGVQVTVYDVLGTNLDAVLRNFSFQLNGAQTVVINVSGAVGSLNNLNTFTGQNKVLWNFSDQTNLTLPGWAGTILAPDASLTINGVSQGNIVAASLNQGNHEIHNYAFTGDLSFVPTNVPPIDVNAPGGLASLLLGAVGLTLARRRSAATTPSLS